MTVAEEIKYFVPKMLMQYLVNTVIIYLFIAFFALMSHDSYARLHEATIELVDTTADVIQISYYHFSGR